jgi:phosphatidate phosphatase APP1
VSDEGKPKQGWRPRTRGMIERSIIRSDDWVDAAFDRLNTRFGRHRPQHIAAYRGFADAQGVELLGRVLAQKPLGGPGEKDSWWDNLLNTYRRFDTDEVPRVPLTATFRGMRYDTQTDHEGYYDATFAPKDPATDALWAEARVTLQDGTLDTPQPVLQVLPHAQFGIISDIDDTILQSSITDWKIAAQLTFLGNARTRKPLLGVAKLYGALQADRNPLFYVSSSPWNLYDLLDDFLELNHIPAGPIFLRDLGTDTGKFIKTPGHGHKLDRARMLIQRNPQLRWVLLGDSGQADAELYAAAAQEFGDRIAAIYIRDVDPDSDSPLDIGVDAYIEKVAGTRVPMLRAKDSVAIAEHAASIGLIDAAAIPVVVGEVHKDAQRPTLAQAAVEEAVDQVKPKGSAGTDA